MENIIETFMKEEQAILIVALCLLSIVRCSKQNRYENRNESIKRVFVPYRCILDYLWYGMAILYLIKYGNPNFSRNFSPVFFAFSK